MWHWNAIIQGIFEIISQKIFYFTLASAIKVELSPIPDQSGPGPTCDGRWLLRYSAIYWPMILKRMSTVIQYSVVEFFRVRTWWLLCFHRQKLTGSHLYFSISNSDLPHWIEKQVHFFAEFWMVLFPFTCFSVFHWHFHIEHFQHFRW